jgi:hypothetical protein
VFIPVFSTGTKAAEKSGINQECNISDLIKQLNTRHRADASRQLVKIGEPAMDYSGLACQD